MLARLSLSLVIVILLFSQKILAQTISFPCVSGNSITIAAVGDLLLHHPLQRKASKAGFQSLWTEALPFVHAANIAYANLEGPMASGVSSNGHIVASKKWDENVYSSYPQFNYHPSLAQALHDSGFDIVSTANNHALDRFSIGIDKTIHELTNANINFTGTRLKYSNDSRVAILHKNNWKIAWIACTEMTNGMTDTYKQVLYCYKKKDRAWILNTIQNLRHQVDAIIITPHWGEEYHTHPNDQQRAFAHQLLDAGATAVIGSHPHVLQPMEKYITADGRATFIAYSLGNFVSYQSSIKTRSTVILFLGLTKNSKGTVINGIRFTPMYMQNRNGNLSLTCISNGNNPTAMQFIKNILPDGNMIMDGKISTDPECRASISLSR